MEISSILVLLITMTFMLRIVRQSKDKTFSKTGETYPEERGSSTMTEYQTQDSEANDLGFEIPKMRRAPRIERQGGIYQDGVYHETKQHGDSHFPLTGQPCIASVKESSIQEGRHACAAGEAPSEYKGERPTPVREEPVQPVEKAKPIFSANDLRAAFVMTEVLGKPKSLKRK